MVGRYTTLVIDDEKSARDRIIRLTKHFPDTFEIIGVAPNGTIGLEMIENLQPDLIFLDIQMPGLSGFEILERMTAAPLVIFSTAYDEYALKAFEANGMDYLLKPLQLNRLTQTVAKLEQVSTSTISKKELLDVLKDLQQQPQEKKATSFTIKKGDRMVLLKIADILYFEASEKYAYIYDNKGNKHLTEQSLIQISKSLPDSFIRIHRSLMVNFDHVTEVQKYFNRRFIIHLDGKEPLKLISARSAYEQIKEKINI